MNICGIRLYLIEIREWKIIYKWWWGGGGATEGEIIRVIDWGNDFAIVKYVGF